MEFAVAQEGSEPTSVMSYVTTPLNEWTHVAVCLDNSKATIYINGQLDASAGYGQRGSYEDCRLWISSLGRDTRFYIVVIFNHFKGESLWCRQRPLLAN